MDYSEVEGEVLGIAHYVTGRGPGSILPGHYFTENLKWEDFDWNDFLMEVESSFGVLMTDGMTDKLRERTLADFSMYVHELID